MFAEKGIRAGTRILDDEVLFWIADSSIDECIEDRISASLGSLPPEQQEQFEALRYPHHHTWTPLVSRFLANSFKMGSGKSGIFLKASRINHSCCPNAFFSWNQNLIRMTVHAIVDIPAGEEITVCYVFPYFSRANRQKVFLEHYGFKCDCPACQIDVPAGQRSELRRREMESLYQAIEKCKGDPGTSDERELGMVLEFIKLAKDDQVDGLFLSCMYTRAIACYLDRGSHELALPYAEMELETDTRLLGEDHELTIGTARGLEELKAELAMTKSVENNDEKSNASWRKIAKNEGQSLGLL